MVIKQKNMKNQNLVRDGPSWKLNKLQLQYLKEGG